MMNSNYEINEEDVTQYIKSHKNQLKYQEALFVEYLKCYHWFTPETKVIFIQKYNLMTLPMEELKSIMNRLNQKIEHVPAFKETSKSIRNLDIFGIIYILVPTLKYYGINEIGKVQFNLELLRILSELSIPSVNNPNYIVESVIDNYKIADQVLLDDSFLKIKLGKEYCRNMLYCYAKIYGKENVEKVKKLVRNTKCSLEIKE